jgi:hypothetical protein
MRARKFLLIAGVAIVAVVAARALGLWVGESLFSPPTNPTSTPALVFAEGDLTFGPIPESEQVERELRLTNTSAEPITIERFETTCSCLGVETAGGLTLAGGETKSLRIKLKASIPVNANLPADGLFHETVTVTAVVPATVHLPRRLPTQFRYTVRQTVAFDPPVVSFGVVSHREPLVAKATLTMLPPITDVRVLPHPEWDVKVTAKGKHQREVMATPTRLGVPRVLNDLLQVVPVGQDGEERPTRFVAIRGEVMQDIVSTPADLSLGRVKVGTTVEDSCRLISLTGRKFEVGLATSDKPEVTTSADPSDPCLLNLRVRTTATSDQVRWVVVTVKQDNGQACDVRIPVRYLGE